MPGTAAGARGVRRSVPGCAASPSTAGKVRLHGQLCTAPTSSAKQCPAPPFPTAEQCCRALLLREPAWPLGYSLHGTGVYRDTGLHIWKREGLPNLHLSASLWLPAGCRQVEGKGLTGPVCFGMCYLPLGGMRLWSSLPKPWKRIPAGGWGAGLESFTWLCPPCPHSGALRQGSTALVRVRLLVAPGFLLPHTEGREVRA